MGDQVFGDLGASLLKSGVAPRHVSGILAELHDHLDDLRQEAIVDGYDNVAANERALRRIGDQRLLARTILARPELRTWPYRYPWLARVYYPLAYVLLLPAVPVLGRVVQTSLVMRWGAALLLSATVTAAMMLAMQLSIALG